MSQSEIFQKKINWNYEIALTFVALVFTAVATVFLLQDIGGILVEKAVAGSAMDITKQSVFMLIVLFLVYGNAVYQLSRFGFLLRDKRHVHAPKEDMSYLYHEDAPGLTILVPSYKEEIKVIHQTLLSAALQQYPYKNITLLVDDPPSPDRITDISALAAARNLPKEIAAFLEPPRRRYERARDLFLRTSSQGNVDMAAEALKLAALYDDAAQYLNDYADHYDIQDHTDRLFVEKILRQSAKIYQMTSISLKNKEKISGASPNKQELEIQYNRLNAGFTAKLSSFERKAFENLSHEKNKAMNINTYIGLMGKSWRAERSMQGMFLHECTEKDADISVPATKYIITLDADSLIAPDYALRLTHVMEAAGNEHLAVIQTPYSAIPGTDNILERVAGATTDIQLLVHQGFTWVNATYWVGANALLRAEALEDIKVIEEERGYEITRYIQDRTVIEDTESSIDLIDKGWSLRNYPARMAYSATPPDYGSLLIQRRRWANGGLIIMPKLLRYIARNLGFQKLAECFVRLHYLISITVSSLGVLILIMYPFENVMRTVWLPLSAVPYFYLYGRDLCLSGYKWIDLPRVYALNLMLVPINLGGVFKSIEQSITKEKIPFVRTPKVGNRTAAPPLYIISTAMIFFYCLFAAAMDVFDGRWMHAGFAAINGLFFGYGCTYFIGWKEGFEDVKAALSAQQKKLSVPALTVLPKNIKIWPLHSGQTHATNRAENPRRPPEGQRLEDQDQYRDAA